MSDLDAQVWFAGKMPRATADLRLSAPGLEPGSFLVRQSETSANSYTLCVKMTNEVKNFRISMSGGMYCISKNSPFPDVVLLINSHLKQGLSVDGQLVKIKPMSVNPYASRPSYPNPDNVSSPAGRPAAPAPSTPGTPYGQPIPDTGVAAITTQHEYGNNELEQMPVVTMQPEYGNEEMEKALPKPPIARGDAHISYGVHSVGPSGLQRGSSMRGQGQGGQQELNYGVGGANYGVGGASAGGGDEHYGQIGPSTTAAVAARQDLVYGDDEGQIPVATQQQTYEDMDEDYEYEKEPSFPGAPPPARMPTMPVVSDESPYSTMPGAEPAAPLLVVASEGAYDVLPAAGTNFQRGSANDPNVVAAKLGTMKLAPEESFYGNDTAAASSASKKQTWTPPGLQNQNPVSTPPRGQAAPAIVVRNEPAYGNQSVVDQHRS